MTDAATERPARGKRDRILQVAHDTVAAKGFDACR